MVDWPEPQAREDALLVKSRGIGICGTDLEIVDGEYGEAPPGEERLILGHESLGEVIEAPAGSKFAPGDLVVVRRRTPSPATTATGRVGYVPQRPLSGVRDQADRTATPAKSTASIPSSPCRSIPGSESLACSSSGFGRRQGLAWCACTSSNAQTCRQELR